MPDHLMEFNAQLAATNLQGFADLVGEMRRTQSDYFKTRSPQTLRESKQLEKMVDRAIAIVRGEKKPQEEMAL